jgi:hypothetical protein
MSALSPTLDDYRAAQIIVEQFGNDAEQQALRHIDRLFETGDHDGVTRWMNVLTAVQELRRTQRSDGLFH